jgi:hypothetical protein
MGQVTFGVDAGAGGAATRVFQVPNANLARLVAWSKANLLPAANPEADPPVPAPTNAEAIEAWAQFMMDRTRGYVQNWERKTASVDFPVG